MSTSIASQRLLWRFRDNLVDLFKARRPRGIAIALSGGVDSMALAWLCHQWSILQRNTDLCETAGAIPIHAIIINHKLRPESDQDVLVTSDRYRKLTGRDPLVLTLDWNAHGGIPSRNALETRARHLRYRALGLACREHQLDTIFTGHHADDNAETLLLRIVSGARTIGLHGIAPLARIPECDDLYGVAERSVVDRAETRNSSQKVADGLDRLGPGVQLARPVLDFDKCDLISLCRDNGVEWAEDSSNHDRTLTKRNTVRHLLNSGMLPKSFNKPALLDLARAKSAELRQEKRAVQGLIKHSEIILDTKSGVLSVVPPPNIHSKDVSWHVKRRFIRDLALAVSSKSDLDLREFEKITQQILAIDSNLRHCLAQKISGHGDSSPRSQKIWQSPENAAGGVAAAITIASSSTKGLSVAWRFARQALTKTEAAKCRLTLTKTQNGFETPDNPDLTRWDGRFWLKIIYSCVTSSQQPSTQDRVPLATSYSNDIAHSLPVNNLVIREWRGEHLTYLRQLAKHTADGPEKRSAIQALVNYNRMLRFRDMKLVLPVLVEIRSDDLCKTEKLVAIPALGYISPGYVGHLHIDLAFKSTGNTGAVVKEGKGLA